VSGYKFELALLNSDDRELCGEMCKFGKFLFEARVESCL
jgi:hypothetical protein